MGKLGLSGVLSDRGLYRRFPCVAVMPPQLYELGHPSLGLLGKVGQDRANFLGLLCKLNGMT